jgi:acetate---CoA ligase (ADP-forming)
VTHKSNLGLVLLNLSCEVDLRQAVGLLSERCEALGVSPEGLLVAQQMTGGVEVIIGVHRDPEVGPVVMFGSGGVLSELVHDVSFGPPGLDEIRARNMILSTRVADLIKGYRGSQPGDFAALVGAVKAMGALAIAGGDLLESAEINPLLVRPDGVYALDALLVMRGKPPGDDGPMT